MRIVLDTNVYVTDFWMKGTDFQTMLSSFTVTGHKLFVPAIVADEVCQKYREHLSKCRFELEKVHTALTRLVPNFKPQSTLPLDGVGAQFASRFMDTLRLAGARFLPYPRTSHASFARRAVKKQRPFDEKGAGYRDALVWDAVLNLARGRGDDIALVTQDVGDFLKKSGDDIALHPELASDAKRALGRDKRIGVYHTLSRFVGQEIQPRLEELGGVRDAIQEQGRIGKLDVRGALLAELKRVLEHEYINPQWLGFPQGAQHGTIEEVTGVPSVNVREVRRLSDARLLLLVSAAVEMRFFMAYPELPPIETALVEDHLDTSTVPFEWDDSEVGAFTADLRVLVNKSRSKIASVQLRSLVPAV